jgi:DNA-binding NarL/FixJ family response regulator
VREEGQTMDGYRLLASTRAAGIPTIVVSGTAGPPDIERAYAEHGIFAYLEKQAFDRRAFLCTVAETQTACRPGSELDCLTDREREVLELLARGMTNKEIAEALVITTNTVKRHLKAIFEKLEIHTRSAAAAKAINAGVPAAQNVPANGD